MSGLYQGPASDRLMSRTFHRTANRYVFCKEFSFRKESSMPEGIGGYWKMVKIWRKMHWFLIALVLIVTPVSPLAAVEKTFLLMFPDCTDWGPCIWIRSILWNKDGIVGVEALPENAISITFDDQKTDPETILHTLADGGVKITGRSSREQKIFKTPFSYE